MRNNLRLHRRIVLQGLAALAAAPARADGPAVKLRLLETSDVHTFDEDYDYFRDQRDESVGLTKVATLIRAARAQVRNSLLFDNGDIIQGNPLADYVAVPGNFPRDRVHPTIRAMNTLGYDAATVGNHEFNYGLDFCTQALAGAKFPFCCANILNADGTHYLPPVIVLERNFIGEDGSAQNMKIGVIGLVTPQIVEWDRAHLAGRVSTLDIVEAAQAQVPGLRAQVDLLVALSHSGISTVPRRGGEENASYYLAEVPGIDVIFTGHSHRVFPGEDYAGIDGVDAVRGMLGNVPAVMPGFWGSALGVIDLTLTRADGRWVVSDFSCATQEISERDGAVVQALVGNDSRVDAAVAPEHAKTLAWIREPIGRLRRPVNSYLAFVGNDTSLALVNAAQAWYAAPLLPQGLPILSAAAPFKEGYQSPDNYIDLAEGTIAIRDVADLYMYPNTVAVVKVDGDGLREWLERSAEVFNRIDPNEPGPQELLNRHVPSYVFDVIAGITYQIDITQPARYGAHGRKREGARRIVDLRYRGGPVDAGQEFLVVTNNYRADSGHVARDPSDVVLRAPDQTRDVLIRYILAKRELDVAAPEVWSFTPIGVPVVVTFESSPAAAGVLLRERNIASLGDAGGGFVRFALTLS